MKNIDKFLNTLNDYFLYDSITKREEYFGYKLFKPLYFFRLKSELLNYIASNVETPTTTVDNLLSIKLKQFNDSQKVFLLNNILFDLKNNTKLVNQNNYSFSKAHVLYMDLLIKYFHYFIECVKDKKIDSSKTDSLYSYSSLLDVLNPSNNRRLGEISHEQIDSIEESKSISSEDAPTMSRKEKINKIKWNTDIKELAYIFFLLKNKNIISVENLGLAISNTFYRENQKPITNILINKYIAEFRNSFYPRKAILIEEFIDKLNQEV